MGVSGQRHAPAALCPGERTPGTHCTGGWVDPRAGLDTEARGKILSPLLRIDPRSPGRPVHSHTLYCHSAHLVSLEEPQKGRPWSDPGRSAGGKERLGGCYLCSHEMWHERKLKYYFFYMRKFFGPYRIMTGLKAMNGGPCGILLNELFYLCTCLY
jgi:hypothetical protein